MDNSPRGYLFLHNISKKNNIGNIVRSACAFGIEKVLYVSKNPDSKKNKLLKEFSFFGNQGTYKQIDFLPFASLEQARLYFRDNDIRLCGVEIGEGSIPIQKHPFTGNTAFIFGNEGTGMLPMHKAMCDFLVYIPQYTEKTASLNVSVAAGIIFHHWGLWAGYQQAKLYGEKYQPIDHRPRKSIEGEDAQMQEGDQPESIQGVLDTIKPDFKDPQEPVSKQPSEDINL